MDVRQLRLVVTVDDFDAALGFYRDQLGLAEEAAFTGPGTRVSILAAGRATLEIADRGHAAFVDEVEVGRRVAGPVRVAFEVEDSAVTTDRLVRAGAQLVAPPTVTPWQSLNARLDGPGDLHLTVFADAREPARRSEAEIMVGRVGAVERIDAPVLLVEPDPQWPATAAGQVDDNKRVHGDGAQLVEHAGSTSVPGLAAKPLIDLVLAVPDPTDEAAYVPALEELGYQLRVREPDWHQHRLLRLTDPVVNLHVFELGSVEIDRMLVFRDHLRTDPDDRALYERTKRGLARQTWEFVQQYADAKSGVVEQILARAARRGERPLVAGSVRLPAGSPIAATAGGLAHELGVPLLSAAAVAQAAQDAGDALTPAATAAVTLSMAAAAPAAVVVGATDRALLVLPDREIPLPDLPVGDPPDVARLARAVRQLARTADR